MYLVDDLKYEWMINAGKAVSNPLLPDYARLQAAVEHTKALELLEKVDPTLATTLIKTYAAQMDKFLMAASDPSETPFLRQFILNFTIKNGLYHISKAGALQLAQKSSFDSAAFSIADTAAQSIDLKPIKKTMHQIMADPTDDIDVRRDALRAHLTVTLHEEYKFRQVPPDFSNRAGVYPDRSP